MMVRQVFPQPTAFSPLLTQEFRPRPVADAINPLIGLKLNPPAFPQQPYPATEQAGPTMARAALADTPSPPSRPSDLGTVLSRAVVADPPAPPVRPTGQAGQSRQAPLTTNDLFGTVQLNPNQRNAPIYTALNLGNLFGGGGQSAPAPAAAAPAVAASGGARGGQAGPDMTGVTFDANGNPSYDGLDASILSAPGLQQQDPAQLASTVGRANWWKSLR